jgi:hypothetical protein
LLGLEAMGSSLTGFEPPSAASTLGRTQGAGLQVTAGVAMACEIRAFGRITLPAEMARAINTAPD